MLSKKILLRLALIVGLIILIPPIFFTFKFYAVPISNDISDWGAYGDFIGGILNPIIALAGTLVLGYLSYQISKQSTDENKNLFLFEQRVLAYQRVSFLLSNVKLALNKGHVYNNVREKYDGLIYKEKKIENDIKYTEELFLSISKIEIEIRYFNKNYGYLFDYNFESKKFKTLPDKCNKFFKNLLKFDPSKEKEFKIFGENVLKEVEEFVNEIRKELI